MKRYILVLLVLLLSYSMGVAQGVSQSVLGATAQVELLEYTSDSVRLTMSFDIENLEIGSQQSIVFSPSMFKGEKIVELPTLVVESRGGARAYQRAKALGNKKVLAQYDAIYGSPYRVIDYYGEFDKGDEVRYDLTIGYESWMVDSQLGISCTRSGCCRAEDVGVLVPEVKLLSMTGDVVETLIPYVEFVKPEKVDVKVRTMQYTTHLTFRVNQTVIEPYLANNSEELHSIDNMMMEALTDDDYTITGVNITGYASPEGTISTNMKLSEGRAHALEALMCRLYWEISPSMYTVEYGGENWDALSEIVQSVDLPYKQEILDIIRYVPIDKGREKMLMELNGGRTYKYLLANIFPVTRVAVVAVEFTVEPYDVDEVRELLYTKAENLSLEEMYRLSEMYSVEDKVFEDIFIIAGRLHPDDIVAQHNALVVELRLGNIDKAAEFAARLEASADFSTASPQMINTLGAYYLVVGDYSRAEELLMRAQSLGYSGAQPNLEDLSELTKDGSQE